MREYDFFVKLIPGDDTVYTGLRLISKSSHVFYYDFLFSSVQSIAELIEEVDQIQIYNSNATGFDHWNAEAYFVGKSKRVVEKLNPLVKEDQALWLHLVNTFSKASVILLLDGLHHFAMCNPSHEYITTSTNLVHKLSYLFGVGYSSDKTPVSWNTININPLDEISLGYAFLHDMGVFDWGSALELAAKKVNLVLGGHSGTFRFLIRNEVMFDSYFDIGKEVTLYYGFKDCVADEVFNTNNPAYIDKISTSDLLTIFINFKHFITRNISFT